MSKKRAKPEDSDREEAEEDWDGYVNFYDLVKKKTPYKNPRKHLHGLEHPAGFWIAGRTGAGKTNCLLNIIKQMDCFEIIYVYCKVKDEPLYDLLGKKFPGKVVITTDIDKMPTLSEDSKKQGAAIFDDCVADPKKVQVEIKKFAIACRKRNWSIFYLSQNYFVPSMPIIKEIRSQCRYFFFLRGLTNKDLQIISTDFSDDRVKEEEIRRWYRYCVDEDQPFWVNLNIKGDDTKEKFRCGFKNGFIASSEKKRKLVS